MTRQRRHIRRSKFGRRFVAGRGITNIALSTADHKITSVDIGGGRYASQITITRGRKTRTLKGLWTILPADPTKGTFGYTRYRRIK